MLEAGRIPSVGELLEHECGTKTSLELDSASLNMSTPDWETMHGLQSMGENCDVVSMYGADLEDNKQA
jgi:hypothetical protein